jgi:2-oxoglutarate/2-oxoacid ferredoxin oxidoreductase subunit alpha
LEQYQAQSMCAAMAASSLTGASGSWLAGGGSSAPRIVVQPFGDAMSVIDTDVTPQESGLHELSVVNDFSIVVATVNGSGSQTANNVLIRAIFKMGVPVSGKNLFPSNIQGLPTWYTIRVSKDGYTARREGTEILVAFNPRTAEEDLASLPTGGVCVHPDDMKFAQPREDVAYYPIPVKELVKASGVDAKLRDYIANMAYVGALTELLSIDSGEIYSALDRHFKGKKRAIDSNYSMVTAAAEWVRANHTKRDPFRVAPMNETAGLILIDGNTAGAIGALVGGVTVLAWYPITPSTSLADALTDYAPLLRTDDATGTPTYAIVQAEDELAAAGMVVGAGWAGARAMTNTSGPGISLMNEFVGLAYFAEVPSVFWDVMRMGPGLAGRPAHRLPHGPRRHAPRRAAARLDAGVLRVRLARLRPGRPAADAGAGAERPGPGHEQLDDPAAPVP